MKFKLSTSLGAGTLILALSLWPLFKSSSTEHDNQDYEDVTAREAFRRVQLQDENGEILPEAVAQAYQQMDAMPILPEAWREFNSGPPSPTNIAPRPPWISLGTGDTGGRIRSIIIHPLDSKIMWVAGVTGGIWKSLDGGSSWKTNTDLMANLNVSCMAIDPINPNILYAGTGGETEWGHGLFKTVDGGAHWSPIGSTYNNTDFFAVYHIAISPTDPNLLLIATYPKGIFRSTDGGTNWWHVGDLREIFDVHFNPRDGNKCVASGRKGNAYYSADAGQTWANATWSVSAPKDAPVGTVRLAYSRSNPLIVYALSENVTRLYRSTNGGKTFTPRGSCCSSVLWWANCLWVDPINPDVVIFGGASLFRSVDGGLTGVSQAYVSTPHADHQIIVEDPGYDGSRNRTVYCGTDGGLYRTLNILNTPNPKPPLGTSWINWAKLNNGLSITQFLGAAGNPASGTILGGTQDNGTLHYWPTDSGPWRIIYYGDGGYCQADLTDPNYFYGSLPFLGILRSNDGGYSTQYVGWQLPRNCGGHPCANWTAPFVLDPHDPNSLLAGGSVLWRSNNVRWSEPAQVYWSEIKSATSGFSFISAIAVDPSDSDFIWVGHNDGSIFYTRNGTASVPTWVQVEGLPRRYCSRITIASSSKIYFTFGGYADKNVLRSNDGGLTFQNISSNLPNIPVYCLVVSPLLPDALYIGTQLGVFASSDDGVTWSPTNNGPANVVVFQVFWMGHKLVAATFGRGMFVLGAADQ